MTATNIDEAVKKAKGGESVTITPRQLLSWVGASRRGTNVVSQLRRKMDEAKVTTEPNFEEVYIDAEIELKKSPARKATAAKKETGRAGVDVGSEMGEGQSDDNVEPAHRISRLQAASRMPIMVNPTDSIRLAITLMLQNEFSQIPVKKGPNKIAGVVSWRSICQGLHFSNGCTKVEDCIERHYEVQNSASLFEVIQLVTRYDCVIVMNQAGQVTGLITNADISQEFRNLSEPFLLLGEIENALRRLIDRQFSREDLQSACDPEQPNRNIQSSSDLTFGEYLRLMENPANWDKLQLPLERSHIVNQLEIIRKIRNEVMHFDPDPLDDQSIDALRSSARFLSGLLETIG